MENLIVNSNSRKRRSKNRNKIRSQLNLAIISNIVNKQNKLCIEYPLTSSHKNVVQSKTALQFSTVTQIENNVTKYNSHNNAVKLQFNNEHTFNNIVWKIPYSNGKGNLDTVVTIVPSKYPNKSEMCKALMSIIASYIDESVPDYFKDYDPKNVNRSQMIVTNFKYLQEKDEAKECLMDNVCEQETGLNTKHLSPLTVTEEGATCSEDESPYHRYYPHRLNQ